MKKRSTLDSSKNIIDNRHYASEKKLIRLRKEVNRLYFEQGLSKNKIASIKRVSKHFVIRWTQSMHQDFQQDHRGWPKGQRRKWSQETVHRICQLRQELKSGPSAFYWGPTAIVQAWRNRYSSDPVPPLRTIGAILKDQGLSDPRGRKTSKGASRYLCYPEYSVYETLGNRVMESDFIGHKFIHGQRRPVHFIGFSFKKRPRLRYFSRVEAQTADSFIKHCRNVFVHFEKPDCIKLDNAAATTGNKSHKRTIGRVIHFLLGNQVTPIFSVPRKPFSQASIEGNNSVFARKFWNRHTFTDVSQIDAPLAAFNEASRIYTSYSSPSKRRHRPNEFIPTIYFIRQVHERSQSPKGFIKVQNQDVYLPKAYINYFVLAEWDLAAETLTVFLERNQKLEKIKQVNFLINKKSKNKLLETGALSYCN